MGMNFRLYLMRHSKTEDPGYNKEDFLRNLTSEGEDHAKQAAQFLQKYQIDKIVVSFVKRAVQTSSFIEETLEDPEIEIVEYLYKSNEETVIDKISQQEDKFKHVLVIGHNPIIYNVAMTLVDSNTLEYEKLLETGMPPARIIALDFHDISSWEHIKTTKAEIIEIFTPK